MKKRKIFLYCLLCVLLAGIIATGITIKKVSAEELNPLVVGETYTYQDEGTTVEYIIQEDNKYRCNATHGETVLNFNGSYTYENGIISFYLVEELFEQYTLGENNTLIYYEAETDEPIEEEPKENIEWLSNFKNWLFTGIVSILGSGSVCVIFRFALKKIADDIVEKRLTAKKELDDSETKVNEAHEQLKKEREEFEKDKQEFFKYAVAFYNNSKEAIILIANGTQELVENGTAEKVKEILNGEDKEI